MNSVVKEKISSTQLFCILFVSRLAGLMITGEITLMSLLSQLAVTAVFSVLSFLLSKRKHVESDGKIVYSLCIVIALSSFYSLSDFKDNAVSIGMPSFLALAVIVFAVLYTVRFGIQSVARISGLCAVVLITASVIGITSNFKSVRLNDFSLEIYGVSPMNTIKALDIPVLYYKLSDNVNGNKKRALTLSVVLSYSAAASVWAMCVFVLKNAATVYCYPVFTLYQLGEVGNYNKLDILFTAPMLSAVYLKLYALVLRVKK